MSKPTTKANEATKGAAPFRRKTCLLYAEWLDACRAMPQPSGAMLLQSICEYLLNGEQPPADMEITASLVFTAIKGSLDAQRGRAIAGSTKGESKARKGNQNARKHPKDEATEDAAPQEPEPTPEEQHPELLPPLADDAAAKRAAEILAATPEYSRKGFTFADFTEYANKTIPKQVPNATEYRCKPLTPEEFAEACRIYPKAGELWRVLRANLKSSPARFCDPCTRLFDILCPPFARG